LHEAVKDLKALDSAVGSNVTYREYSSRVTDAKIIVDRFLDRPETADPETVRIVRRAMAYHVAASAVWNAKVSDRLYDNVDPVVYECAEAKELIRQIRRSGWPEAISYRQDFQRKRSWQTLVECR
jgi:hypothetical protein